MNKQDYMKKAVKAARRYTNPPPRASKPSRYREPDYFAAELQKLESAPKEPSPYHWLLGEEAP